MTDLQKQIIKKSIEIRLKRKEDVAEIFKNYKNLTDNEKSKILKEYNLAPYQKSIEEIKAEKIEISRTDLVAYLEKNPLVTDCHDATMKTYTITMEKQSLFTSKYTAHMALLASGVEDVMTWNEQGKSCEPWTDEECIKFIGQWNAITTALVKYQQDMEVAINACNNIDAVNAIIIDYSSADPRNKE